MDRRSQLLQEGQAARRTLGRPLVVGGALHAVWVPLVLVVPDAHGAP